MHILDLLILLAYLAAMLGVGLYFLRRNKNTEDYYVGGRNMGSLHIGLSVVATDVGGGFSIGLGGLGFTMGLSGSWMLFTGLIGAWLAAVVLIPVVKETKAFARLLTFPQMFGHYFNKRVALLAGLISAIGYIGFTSSQILAGAKLAHGTFPSIDTPTALLIMGIVAVVYTVMGGIKAVIYTDTVQWIILMAGLLFIALPIAYHEVGGYSAIVATLPPHFLSLQHISWQTLVNWGVTIIPIWFVGMTLYQRMFATRDTKSAKRAWFYAGLFEWPIMAFMGVALGLLARVAAEQGMFEGLGAATATMVDAETGLPMLLRSILPTGLMGLVMAAYFSAILSTADSCLMAASGNVMTDLAAQWFGLDTNSPRFMRQSQWATLALGALALALASVMTQVLDLMLYSYAFMVSGLLVPIVGGMFWPKASPTGAFWAMLTGGTTTVLLTLWQAGALTGQENTLPAQLDPNVFGLAASLLVFIVGSLVFPAPSKQPTGALV